MIPFLPDLPAPSGALAPVALPVHGAEGAGTGIGARDFAGLLGAALVPPPGAVPESPAPAIAAPDQPALPSAANPAFALPPLGPVSGKSLPLPGADLPLAVADDASLAPFAGGQGPQTRALLVRGGGLTETPRMAVPNGSVQGGTLPGTRPEPVPAALAPAPGEAGASDLVFADHAAAEPALPDVAPPGTRLSALTTDLLPTAPLAPLPVSAGEPAEADAPSLATESDAPAPSPVPAAVPVLAAAPVSLAIAAAVPPPSGAPQAEARPLALACSAPAPVHRPIASAVAHPDSAPAEDSASPAMPAAALRAEAPAEAPAPASAQPGPAPSPAPTLAAASPSPAPFPERADTLRALPPAPQLEQAIDQVGNLREALRAARPEMTLRHAEFGLVSLRLEQAAPEQWRAVLASRDPGFVPAIQLALAERAVAAAAATADSAGTFGQHGASQSGTGDQRYGASPNGGQAGSQPYLGQSGQRDGEAAPDHRRPSTAAALAARAEEEGEAAASSGHHTRGTFA